MRIAGESRENGPCFICSVRTVAGRFGGEVEFLLDSGASYTLLSLLDFRRLGGSLADLRPTKALQLSSLSGKIPCRLLEAIVLEFEGDGEGALELERVFVPTRELWAPSLFGRDFLRQSGWEFRYNPARGECELRT